MTGLQHNNFFVISGGPGSGKSSVIEALIDHGFTAMPEAGRAVIQDQAAIGGTALPWADRQAFAELMLNWELRSYREAASLEKTVVFDRGIPDVIGYLQLCGLNVPSHMRKAAQMYRYNHKIFLAPPWKEIFHQDTERKQSWGEAEDTFSSMVEVYGAYDYEITVLPLMSVEDRAAFMIDHILNLER